jgi:hypothetical protein
MMAPGGRSWDCLGLREDQILERSRSPEIPESDDEALHQQVAELKKRISEIEKFVLESKEGMKSASNLFSFLLSRGRR